MIAPSDVRRGQWARKNLDGSHWLQTMALQMGRQTALRGRTGGALDQHLVQLSNAVANQRLGLVAVIVQPFLASYSFPIPSIQPVLQASGERRRKGRSLARNTNGEQKQKASDDGHCCSIHTLT